MTGKEPMIVMMRVGEERYKGEQVIECTYVDIADGESTLDAEPIHEVTMRITGPALLGLWKSIEEECDRTELRISCYKLKPCPFCGGSGTVIENMGAFSVRCSYCDAHIGGWFRHAEDAMREWNWRSGE